MPSTRLMATVYSRSEIARVIDRARTVAVVGVAVLDIAIAELALQGLQR
jgi:hypothetical protein